MDALALCQRLRLARPVGPGSHYPGFRAKNEISAVGAPDRESEIPVAEGQFGHRVPLPVVCPDIQARSAREGQLNQLSIRGKMRLAVCAGLGRERLQLTVVLQPLQSRQPARSAATGNGVPRASKASGSNGVANSVPLLT